MEHKYQNELNLLKSAIDRIPFTFPENEKKKFEEEYANLEASPETTRDNIEAMIVGVGKANWPYRKAYQDILQNYGADKYEEFFKLHLPENLRAKYEDYINRGGNLHDFRHGKDFEKEFTADENLAIEEAFFSAEDEIKGFMMSAVKEHKDEYDESFKIYEKKQKILANMIESLREMAGESEKWSPQILDKVKNFEEGWSIIDRDFDEDKLKHEIEYWEGVLGLE